MTSDDLFASVARGGLTALAFGPNDKPWRLSTSGIASLILRTPWGRAGEQ